LANTGRLRLIWWTGQGFNEVPPSNVTPQFEFIRVADSGDQAGEVDLLASIGLSFGDFSDVLTAVKGTQSGRLKLILWRLFGG
jgi:hypothetical protein